MSKFTVTVNNKDADQKKGWWFYMYQTCPDLEAGGFKSTCWLVNSYKTGVGVSDKFNWEVDYGLFWSHTENVNPGTVIQQQGGVSVDLAGPNHTRFQLQDQMPELTEPVKEPVAGTLYIDTRHSNPIIPSATFAVGLTVKDKVAFAGEAKNNILLSMTPKPRYWLVAANNVLESAVLDVSEVSDAVEIQFQGGKNNAIVDFKNGQIWSDVTYKA